MFEKKVCTNRLVWRLLLLLIGSVRGTLFWVSKKKRGEGDDRLVGEDDGRGFGFRSSTFSDPRDVPMEVVWTEREQRRQSVCGRDRRQRLVEKENREWERQKRDIGRETVGERERVCEGKQEGLVTIQGHARTVRSSHPLRTEGGELRSGSSRAELALRSGRRTSEEGWKES